MTTFHTPWRPIFESPPAFSPVASDCRLAIVQQQDFLVRARRMGADEKERGEIVEALQLCERCYGYGSVDGALPFVEGVLACAAFSLQVPLRRVASLCGLPSSGVLAGALIEEALKVESTARRFPLGHVMAQPAGLGLSFGDCVTAARWMDAMHLLTPAHVDRLRAYAHLARAIRTQAGAPGLRRTAEMIEHAVSEESNPETAFMRAIAEAAQTKHIDMGLVWDWYVRLAQRPTHIQMWLIDVAPPAQETP